MLPGVVVGTLAEGEHAAHSRGVALCVGTPGQVGHDLSGLHALQPLDGSLVSLLPGLHAHASGSGCRHVVEGDVGGVHHQLAVSVVALGGECLVAVVSGSQVSRHLLDGLGDGVLHVDGVGLRDDLQRGFASHHLEIFCADKHLCMNDK